tara:strand:+ start:21 stop:167 length:147 start_codon:yes stop_codon:yes gene_type:complete
LHLVELLEVLVEPQTLRQVLVVQEMVRRARRVARVMPLARQFQWPLLG